MQICDYFIVKIVTILFCNYIMGGLPSIQIYNKNDICRVTFINLTYTYHI